MRWHPSSSVPEMLRLTCLREGRKETKEAEFGACAAALSSVRGLAPSPLTDPPRSWEGQPGAVDGRTLTVLGKDSRGAQTRAVESVQAGKRSEQVSKCRRLEQQPGARTAQACLLRFPLRSLSFPTYNCG